MTLEKPGRVGEVDLHSSSMIALGEVLQAGYRIRLIAAVRMVAIFLQPAPNAKGIGRQALVSYLPNHPAPASGPECIPPSILTLRAPINQPSKRLN